MRNMFAPRVTRFTDGFIVNRKGRAVPPKASTLNWPLQSKFFFVVRALNYPDRGEKGCRRRKVTSHAGRVMWEPIQ